MNGNSWLPNPDLNTEASSSLEMLQTDVMRFLAILALCLMAIFALVQSIPPEAVDATPQLQSRELMAAEAKALEERVEALRFEQEQLRRGVVEARRALAASARESAEKSWQLERLDEQIEAQGTRLMRKREELAKFNAEVLNANRALVELQASLATMRAEINRAKSRLAAQRRALEGSTQATAAEAAATPSVVEPEEASLELRFESDQVLTALVQTGRVGFYAKAAGRFWRLRPDESGLRFTAAEPPQELYEMTAATVPLEFVEALRGRVAAFGRDKIVWGVTLPGSARQAITAGSREHRSGTLVIGPDAGVVHRGL